MLTIKLAKHSDTTSNGNVKTLHQRTKQLTVTRNSSIHGDGDDIDSPLHKRAKGSANEGNCSRAVAETRKLSKNMATNVEISGVDIAGYKVVRRAGEKVHFCVKCDFPIAVYGKLEPCLHALCLTCAKAEKRCFLCGAEVSRLSVLNRLDGLSICGAPGCLQCFSDRQELIRHVRSAHQDLAQGTLHKLRAEAVALFKGIVSTTSQKRPRTAEPTPAAKARGELSVSVSKTVISSVAPAIGDPTVSAATPPATTSASQSASHSLSSHTLAHSHAHAHAPSHGQHGSGHEHAGERNQQSSAHSQQHHLLFPEPRQHPMQVPPDFHPGHMGHSGMPGSGGHGMGPRDMMGQMDGPGQGRPPWMGPMGPHPYLDHRPPYDGHFGNQHGPRGSFRPGGPEDFGFFMAPPAFGGGWRPPLQ